MNSWLPSPTKPQSQQTRPTPPPHTPLFSCAFPSQQISKYIGALFSFFTSASHISHNGRVKVCFARGSGSHGPLFGQRPHLGATRANHHSCVDKNSLPGSITSSSSTSPKSNNAGPGTSRGQQPARSRRDLTNAHSRAALCQVFDSIFCEWCMGFPERVWLTIGKTMFPWRASSSTPTQSMHTCRISRYCRVRARCRCPVSPRLLTRCRHVCQTPGRQANPSRVAGEVQDAGQPRIPPVRQAILGPALPRPRVRPCLAS
jgi:hypothetical protein